MYSKAGVVDLAADKNKCFVTSRTYELQFFVLPENQELYALVYLKDELKMELYESITCFSRNSSLPSQQQGMSE